MFHCNGMRSQEAPASAVDTSFPAPLSNQVGLYPWIGYRRIVSRADRTFSDALLEMDDHDRPVVCIHSGSAALYRRIASDFLRVNALYFGEGRFPIV
jgi:hypothetical protein